MSGLDVEALLESTAAEGAKSTTSEKSSDRKDAERSDRRDHHDRERSPKRERARRDRSRSRDRGRDHRRRRNESEDLRGDYYRAGRGRSRSPDSDRHYRPARRDRSRDKDRRTRSRDRPREDRPRNERPREDRPREGRRSPRDREQARSPQLTEDERDRRTVFVQQLAARLRTRELIEFFEQIGPVRDAQIVKDRVSGRSKGVGYVEFRDPESVAIAKEKLTGQKLLRIPIIVQLTESEKNRQARTTDTNANNAGVPFHRLYVGNIHFSITEDELSQIFSPFGELEEVSLMKDETSRSRGYGFVQFKNPSEAKDALEKMNGFDIAGRPIRVGLGNDRYNDAQTQNMLQRFNNAPEPQFQGSAFSGSGGRGAYAGGGGGTFDRAGGRDTDKGTGGASALDDTDVAGVNFNNFNREALMRKLARTDEPAQNSRNGNAPRVAPKPVPTKGMNVGKCIVIQNAFNPVEEEKSYGPDWVKDIHDDIKGECQDKYGKIVHMSVEPNSDGDIYIKFEKVSGGEEAMKGLNGRFYNSRQITVSPVVEAVYNAQFPESKTARPRALPNSP